MARRQYDDSRDRDMTTRDRVSVGGTTIEYEVRRSARRKKTVQITLDGGGVVVAAPSAVSASELQEIVRKRASWIVDRISEAALQPAPMQFASGETLPYLGRDVPLLVETRNVKSPTVRLDGRRFRVAVPRGLEDSDRYERIRDAVVQWYRAQADERVRASVLRWWPRLGRGERSRILIGDQRSLWGSCASDGTLRFNWRVMMLETALIELIVVHELAHLTVQNHSAQFWGLVAQVIPDVADRRRRLREVGRTLPL